MTDQTPNIQVRADQQNTWHETTFDNESTRIIEDDNDYESTSLKSFNVSSRVLLLMLSVCVLFSAFVCGISSNNNCYCLLDQNFFDHTCCVLYVPVVSMFVPTYYVGYMILTPIAVFVTQSCLGVIQLLNSKFVSIVVCYCLIFFVVYALSFESIRRMYNDCIAYYKQKNFQIALVSFFMLLQMYAITIVVAFVVDCLMMITCSAKPTLVERLNQVIDRVFGTAETAEKVQKSFEMKKLL